MRRIAVSALLCAGVLAGCYGSTEPATEVAFDSAKLNGRGTADKGPAFSYFEYAPTSTGFPGATTTRREWPANASGPLTERAFPLYAGTSYSYRLCGNDQGKSPVCAQTRTFRTPAATRDAVRGSWSYDEGTINARFGEVDATAGAGPSGILRLGRYVDRPLRYAGRITCLRVTGRTAVVGSVGRTSTSGSYPDPDATPDARALVTIVDGGPGVRDRADAVDLFPIAAPPVDCAAAHPPSDNEADGETVNVYDAP